VPNTPKLSEAESEDRQLLDARR